MLKKVNRVIIKLKIKLKLLFFLFFYFNFLEVKKEYFVYQEKI